MADKNHPNEIFNFVIQHDVILFVGLVVMSLTTTYTIRNRKNVTRLIFMQSIFLLLLSWWGFYIVLLGDQSESLTSLAAGIGTFLPVLTICMVWVNKE